MQNVRPRSRSEAPDKIRLTLAEKCADHERTLCDLCRCRQILSPARCQFLRRRVPRKRTGGVTSRSAASAPAKTGNLRSLCWSISCQRAGGQPDPWLLDSGRVKRATGGGGISREATAQRPPARLRAATEERSAGIISLTPGSLASESSWLLRLTGGLKRPNTFKHFSDHRSRLIRWPGDGDEHACGMLEDHPCNADADAPEGLESEGSSEACHLSLATRSQKATACRFLSSHRTWSLPLADHTDGARALRQIISHVHRLLCKREGEPNISCRARQQRSAEALRQRVARHSCPARTTFESSAGHAAYVSPLPVHCHYRRIRAPSLQSLRVYLMPWTERAGESHSTGPTSPLL